MSILSQVSPSQTTTTNASSCDSSNQTIRKSVTFSVAAPATTSIPSSENGVPPSTLWYTIEELVEMRRENKLLCKQTIASMERSSHYSAKENAHFLVMSEGTATRPLQAHKRRHPRTTKRHQLLYVSHSNSELRGLEYACCLERQRRSLLGRRWIVRTAQLHRAKGSRYLAAAAEDCTAWATAVALRQAEHDATAAWCCTKDVEVSSSGPRSLQLLTNMTSATPPSPQVGSAA